MDVYVKYVILTVGLLAAVIGIFNLETAPAIVSVGAFVAYALIEIRDLKTLNDDKE